MCGRFTWALIHSAAFFVLATTEDESWMEDVKLPATDDKNVIGYRNLNKVGVWVTVTPLYAGEEIKVSSFPYLLCVVFILFLFFC